MLAVCAVTALLNAAPLPVCPLLSSGLPVLRHNSVEIRPVSNPARAPKCSSERESLTPVTLKARND